MEKEDKIFLGIFAILLSLFFGFNLYVIIDRDNNLNSMCKLHYNVDKHTDVKFRLNGEADYKIECGENNILECKSIWINKTKVDKWGEEQIKTEYIEDICYILSIEV